MKESLRPPDHQEDKLSFIEPEYARNTAKSSGDYLILVKGNSISRHGWNESTRKNLDWDRECGMAASSEGNDYVHLLAAAIENAMPGRRVRIVFGKGGRPDLAVQTVEEEKKYCPDLIIVQDGEHSASEAGIVTYEFDYDRLLGELAVFPGKPGLLAIGIWNPRCREEFQSCTGENYDVYAVEIARIQKRVAARHGAEFVDVSIYENDPANTGTGAVAGVRWHPNDNGMRCYAEAAYAAFESAFLRSRT